MASPQFQPTPSSRRVTATWVPSVTLAQISTNTLLTEGDWKEKYGGDGYFISTNTLLTEGDRETGVVEFPPDVFQPTPSSRRVTAA